MGENEIENQKEFESFLSQSLKSDIDFNTYLEIENSSQEKIYKKLKDQEIKKLKNESLFSIFFNKYRLLLVVFVVCFVSIFSLSTLNYSRRTTDSSKFDNESIFKVDSVISEIDSALATLDYGVWEVNDVGVSY